MGWGWLLLAVGVGVGLGGGVELGVAEADTVAWAPVGAITCCLVAIASLGLPAR